MTTHPKAVYRFFDEEAYADQFLEGKIRISTLEICRQHEDSERGDKGEASISYSTGIIRGSGKDTHIVEMARRASIGIGKGIRKAHIENARSERQIFDAFLLCTTLEPEPDIFDKHIGKFCVEIRSPLEFMKQLTLAIDDKRRVSGGNIGCVTYEERHYAGMENPPGLIGFVKPAVPYAAQKEYRMLWYPEDMTNLGHLDIYCPALAKFCKRIA